MVDSPYHLLLVEDNDELRTNLHTWLTLAGYQVHAAASAESALTLASCHPIALAVLDFRLPGMTGLDLLALLQARDPSLLAVFLSGEGTMEVAIAALREGRASDFLQKPLLDMNLLGEAIKRALAHRGPGPASAAKPDRCLDALSPRERQILGLLGEGLSNRAIAQRLSRTEKTIRNQLSDIYQKLDVSNRTQAVMQWQQASKTR